MMRISNAIRSKMKIIVPVSIFGAGLYLLTSQHMFTPSPVSVSDSNIPEVLIEARESKSSTTLLIEQAAKETLAKADENRTSYPNVTPTYLEKPFSPTLEGTDIDGQLKVGEDGKLMLGMEVKDFFDYFLSAVGEVTPELALSELLRVAHESLPPENFEEAKALLDNYLAYKEDAVQLMSQPMLPRDQQTREYQLQIMEDSLRQLRDLRRQHMPEAQVEAFFGMEEAYEDYTIATVRVQFDDTLSQEEKASMIQYHRSQLPEEIRQTETRIAQESSRNAEIHQAIDSDDADALANQLDAHNYTEAQKEEILAYQQSQLEFDRRYEAYLAEKTERLADIDNEEEQAEIVSSLQDEFFTNERERTQAKVRDLRS